MTRKQSLSPEAGRLIADVEYYAERLMQAQNIFQGSVRMNVENGESTPVPPLHVAAVLHALADHTHNRHILEVIVAQEALALDNYGQAFSPKATSLGRYFHALADHIERLEEKKIHD